MQKTQVKTLKQLAEYVHGQLYGDGGMEIRSAATLEKAQAGEITFLSNSKYTPLVGQTRAGAILVSEKTDTPAAQIVVKDPYYAFMQIVVLLHGHRKHPKTGVSKSANIAENAKIGNGCNIHPLATISEDVVLGENCQVYPGVFIGRGAVLGEDCIVYPNAVIYNDCQIGNRVIIQANAIVGQDGFGFATYEGQHHKIPQIGRVILQDDVEIGAGCAIERGTLDDTVIGAGSKIGDLAAIGHGTRIGPGCLLVPQVGVAGSVTLGHHCVIGGQAGIAGHIKIGNMVKIGAQAGVIGDVPDGATIVGAPAIDAGRAKRAYSLIEYLPEIKKKIKIMEKQLEKLQPDDRKA